MDTQFAESFAEHWYKAWNDHDLDAIMEHYADDIVFYSPIIKERGVNADGKVVGKEALRAYFTIGLQAYPDLHFQPKDMMLGAGSMVLLYTSINNRRSTEAFRFNAVGKVAEVWAHYGV